MSVGSRFATAYNYFKLFRFLLKETEKESVATGQAIPQRTFELAECERAGIKQSVFFDFNKVRKFKEYREAYPEVYISSDSDIGVGASLGRGSAIWSSRVERSVALGEYSTMSEGCFVGGEAEVRIGSFCSIARNCFIYSTCHNYKLRTTSPLRSMRANGSQSACSEFVSHPVQIGNDVWLGRDVKILAGAVIPDGSVVGAGAVVTKGEYEPYSILVGVPARCVKKRFSAGTIEELLALRWWDKGDEVFDDEVLDFLLSPPE